MNDETDKEPIFKMKKTKVTIFDFSLGSVNIL
jgi:hypothetical protein